MVAAVAPMAALVAETLPLALVAPWAVAPAAAVALEAVALPLAVMSAASRLPLLPLLPQRVAAVQRRLLSPSPHPPAPSSPPFAPTSPPPFRR